MFLRYICKNDCKKIQWSTHAFFLHLTPLRFKLFPAVYSITENALCHTVLLYVKKRSCMNMMLKMWRSSFCHISSLKNKSHEHTVSYMFSGSSCTHISIVKIIRYHDIIQLDVWLRLCEGQVKLCQIFNLMFFIKSMHFWPRNISGFEMCHLYHVLCVELLKWHS